MGWFFLILSVVSLIAGWGNDVVMYDIVWGTTLILSSLEFAEARIVREIRRGR